MMKIKYLLFFFAPFAASMLLTGCALSANYDDGRIDGDRQLAHLVQQRVQNDTVAARAMVRISVSDGVATIHGRDIGPDVMARIVSITQNTPGIRWVEGHR